MATLKLLNNNTVNEAFVKANKHLLDKYPEISNFQDLKQKWLDDFNCNLSDSLELTFESDRKLSMFILEWG